MRPTTTILAALTSLLILSPVVVAPASAASTSLKVPTATGNQKAPTGRSVTLRSMQDADVEALALLGLLQAIKSSQEDADRPRPQADFAKMSIEDAMVFLLMQTANDQHDDLKALMAEMQISPEELLAAGLQRMTDRYARIYLAITGDPPPSPMIPEFVQFLGRWSDHPYGPSSDAIALEIKKLVSKLVESDRPAALTSLSAWIAAETRPFDLARSLKAKHASSPFDRRWKRLNTLVNLVKGVAEAENLLAGNRDESICPASTNTRIVTIVIPPPDDPPDP